jgi:hypothetical protein
MCWRLTDSVCNKSMGAVGQRFRAPCIPFALHVGQGDHQMGGPVAPAGLLPVGFGLEAQAVDDAPARALL